MRIGKKINVMGVGMVAVTAIVIMGMLFFQKGDLCSQVAEEIDEVTKDQVKRISRDIYTTCLVQNDAVQQKVRSDLNVAHDLISRHGNVSFAEESVSWDAVNQFSKQSTQISLPKMMVGSNWLGKNVSFALKSPIVDDVQELVGGTCTIFQRMNSRGDMLRVATNVKKLDGQRAVGTYIPAYHSGVPNKVISTVLRGETYYGRAYVVNDWYITAYKPIFDDSKKVVGILYVGVKLEMVDSLRDEISKVIVGKEGYILVTQASGSNKGEIIMHGNPSKVGANVWEKRDPDGNLLFQDVTATVKAASRGETVFKYYNWQNKGETEPRQKVAGLVYFPEWDWVIWATAYKSDFNTPVIRIQDALNTTVIQIMGITLVVTIIFSFVGYVVARSITGPLYRVIKGLSAGSEQVNSASGQVSSSSQSMAEGASEQASSLEEISSSLEEMASMTQQNAENAQQANTLAKNARNGAESGVEAMTRMNDAIERIKNSSDETAKIIKTIDEIAFQTNLLALNAAVEAARAGEAGKGFAVVAEEVRNLAQRSAEAAKDTASLIEGSQGNANDGVAASKEVNTILEKIVETSADVANLIEEVTSASNEQALGIENINAGVSQLDKVTQGNAANAEQSAAASEELSAQANELSDMVLELTALVEGTLSSKDGANQFPANSDRTLVVVETPAAKPSPQTLQSRKRITAAEPAGKRATVAEQAIPLDDDF